MNPIIVLDASVFVAWVSPTQRTDAAMQLLADKARLRFIVPSIFQVEVRNVLLACERRDKWQIAESAEALALLDGLDLVVMPPPFGYELDEAFRVARAERLSMYDGLYLYEAQQHTAAIASRDRAMLAAAQRRGVSIVDVGAQA